MTNIKLCLIGTYCLWSTFDYFRKKFGLLQRKIVSEAPGEDAKNYLLTTSKYGKQIQEDIDPYITRDRLKETSFRRKLDPVAKSVIRKQNPSELVFEDISTFDAQNLIIGSLLKEIDIGKKTFLVR